MALRMQRRLYERIRLHLVRVYPEEGCGFLVGREARIRDVTDAVEAANDSPDPRTRRFVIRPEDFLLAEREARRQGLEVLGFYHSHPDHPARPSQVDVEAAWPWYSYLIVALDRGEATDAACWRLSPDGSRMEREVIELLDDGTRSGGG